MRFREDRRSLDSAGPVQGRRKPAGVPADAPHLDGRLDWTGRDGDIPARLALKVVMVRARESGAGLGKGGRLWHTDLWPAAS